MIGYLTGTLLLVDDEVVLLDVNGVGYEVQASGEALARAHDAAGHRMSLYIYTHVREDQIALYGFAALLEKQVFLQLLTVNGVGPKLALKIVSGGPLDQLLQLIESGDVAALAKFPRVGRKTAEQIVLKLRGVFPTLAAPDGTSRTPPRGSGKSQEAGFAARFGPGTKGEVGSALAHLGFRAPEIEGLLMELPGDLAFEEGVRWGLQRLASI